MTKILVIAAHPDDEVLGCGGVIAKHTAQDDEVRVLIVTRGIPEIFPPEVINGTREELKQAHQLLGISQTYFLDFPAPDLDTIPRRQIADKIGAVIAEYQPETVYTHHYGDIHHDHKAVFQATLVAARPHPTCPVQKILCYETLSETEWAPPFGDDAFIPTIFIDISAYLQKKLAAMSCYQSQLKKAPHARSLEAIEAQARLRGSTVHLAAAEAFMLVREIVK